MGQGSVLANEPTQAVSILPSVEIGARLRLPRLVIPKRRGNKEPWKSSKGDQRDQQEERDHDKDVEDVQGVRVGAAVFLDGSTGCHKGEEHEARKRATPHAPQPSQA